MNWPLEGAAASLKFPWVEKEEKKKPELLEHGCGTRTRSDQHHGREELQ